MLDIARLGPGTVLSPLATSGHKSESSFLTDDSRILLDDQFSPAA